MPDPSYTSNPEDVFGPVAPNRTPAQATEEVSNTKEQPGDKVYMHEGIVWMNIVRTIIAILLGGSLLYEFVNLLTPQAGGLKALIILGMLFFGIFSALYTFKTYENTFFQITRDAIIYRRGWIPSYTDTLFWINIKDINSSVSIRESFLGAGTIILLVGIRNEIGEIRIPFVPNHEKICTIIRNKIGSISSATRQVSYT